MDERTAYCYIHSLMSRTFVDIGVNWVHWLQEQAARRYTWDDKAQYHRVLHEKVAAHTRLPARTLRDAWARLPQELAYFPNLKSNLFVSELDCLPVSARARISAFFTAQGLRDFEFLDHGGRAITYRALHVPTGQIRVARMEAPHCSRFPRPHHSVVLQPFATNEGRMKHYGDIKLEVLPEVVPLSHLYKDINDIEVPLLKKAFQDAVWDLSWGTNLMYSHRMFDRDAEAQNVGLLPDGRIASFDPEVVTGERAERKQSRFKTPRLLRDASAQQLALVYPVFKVS